MRLAPTALTLALALIVTVRAASTAEIDGPWFAAAAPLTMPTVEEPRSLLGIVREYERITDQRLFIDAALEQRLESTGVAFYRPFEVEPEAVTEVFGHVLRFHDVGLTIACRREPRILALHDLRAKVLLHDKINSVAPDELEGFASCPAALVVTTVTLDALDSRTATNSLRAGLLRKGVDAWIPLGERSMVISGFATDVKARIDSLKVADERHAAYLSTNPDFDEQTKRIQAHLRSLQRKRTR